MAMPLNQTPTARGNNSSTSTIRSTWARIRSTGQLVLSIALTIAVLVYLMFFPPAPPLPNSAKENNVIKAVVNTVGPQLIGIEPGSKLETKLQIANVRAAQISTPVLAVTGTVMASLRPGHEKTADYWQFNSPEVLTAYTDWQKAIADIIFAQTQLTQIRQLAESRIASQQKVVDRVKKVIEATGTQKELDAEQANLIQYQIQGRKEIHEAETALRLAERTEAATARQLQQAGLEPELLKATTWDVDIVMADVPEGMLTRVKQGQGCSARFVGLPEELFVGKVNRIAPVISKERRSLRVLFAISDPKDYLRPGMFAEIGIGTDPRQALLVPTEGVLHVGKADYVLVAASDPGTWRVTEVQVGEPHDGLVEVTSGVRAGEQVVGRGAILLKPEIVKSLLAARTNGSAGAGR